MSSAPGDIHRISELAVLRGSSARPRSRSLAIVPRIAAWSLATVLVVALAAPLLPLPDPTHQELASALTGPSAHHWLGTDQLGRDLLSRVVWGTRTTLLAALLAVVIAVAIGLPAGIVAAYRRGVVDVVLGRLADVLLTLPGLVLLLAAQSAIHGGIFVSLAIFGVLLAPQLFRVVRAATLGLARAPFMQAGRMAGASHARILWRYIVPNVVEQLAVQVSFLLGYAVLGETGLSFLGLGVQPPDSSLGTLVADGTTLMAGHPMVLVVPGVLVTFLIAASNLVGDALADRVTSAGEAL